MILKKICRVKGNLVTWNWLILRREKWFDLWIYRSRSLIYKICEAHHMLSRVNLIHSNMKTNLFPWKNYYWREFEYIKNCVQPESCICSVSSIKYGINRWKEKKWTKHQTIFISFAKQWASALYSHSESMMCILI